MLAVAQMMRHITIGEPFISQRDPHPEGGGGTE